jgi:hypothetical protein
MDALTLQNLEISPDRAFQFGQIFSERQGILNNNKNLRCSRNSSSPITVKSVSGEENIHERTANPFWRQ